MRRKALRAFDVLPQLIPENPILLATVLADHFAEALVEGQLKHRAHRALELAGEGRAAFEMLLPPGFDGAIDPHRQVQVFERGVSDNTPYFGLLQIGSLCAFHARNDREAIEWAERARSLAPRADDEIAGVARAVKRAVAVRQASRWGRRAGGARRRRG